MLLNSLCFFKDTAFNYIQSHLITYCFAGKANVVFFLNSDWTLWYYKVASKL